MYKKQKERRVVYWYNRQNHHHHYHHHFYDIKKRKISQMKIRLIRSIGSNVPFVST